MRKPLINPGIIKRLKSFFAIIQDTDTATRYIPAGKYVLYKNIACHASQNIESGDTLALGTNLVTDSDGFVNCLNDGLTTLNNKIATYDFGTNTLANHQTAIVTYAATLSNQSVKNISFTISEAEGVFIQTEYIGQLIKTMNDRINVEVRQALTDTRPIIGKYTNGTWEWDKIALNSKLRSGIEGTGSIPAESTISKQVTFSSPMPTVPSVTVTTRASISTKSNISKVTYNITNVTTSGFTYEAYNSSNAALSLTMNWIAVCE